MVALNFPNNPAGQIPVNTFSPTSTPEASTNGVTYIYNSTNGTWTAETVASGTEAPPTIISDTPPTTREDGSPIESGDLWWNSSTTSGELYVYYVDVDSAQWIEASPSTSDGYLKLDASNGPVTGALAFEKLTTHANGVNVTGNGSVQSGLNYIDDRMQLRYKSQPLIDLREGRSATDYQIRFTGRQQIGYTPVNDAPIIGILPIINGQASWNTDIFTVKPTLTGSFNSLIGLNLDFKEGIASGTSITVDNFYGVRLHRTNQITPGTGKIYGIYTEVEGGGNYNFYAAGDSQNYVKGHFTVSSNPAFLNETETTTMSGIGLYSNGQAFYSMTPGDTNTTVISISRNGSNGQAIKFRKNGVEVGDISVTNNNINISGLNSTSIMRNGHDLSTTDGIVASLANAAAALTAIKAAVADSSTDDAGKFAAIATALASF